MGRPDARRVRAGVAGRPAQRRRGAAGLPLPDGRRPRAGERARRPGAAVQGCLPGARGRRVAAEGRRGRVVRPADAVAAGGRRRPRVRHPRPRHDRGRARPRPAPWGSRPTGSSSNCCSGCAATCRRGWSTRGTASASTCRSEPSGSPTSCAGSESGRPTCCSCSGACSTKGGAESSWRPMGLRRPQAEGHERPVEPVRQSLPAAPGFRPTNPPRVPRPSTPETSGRGRRRTARRRTPRPLRGRARWSAVGGARCGRRRPRARRGSR